MELNNQPSELFQTVKYLRTELQTVKEDNEIILRAQGGLNNILLDKIHNRGKDKINVYETDSETVSNKHKGEKLKYSNSESSSKVNTRSRRGRYKYTRESDCRPIKRKYEPYEEISGEFKKIKPAMFNEKVEKGEEAEAWLSKRKKDFHIFN